MREITIKYYIRHRIEKDALGDVKKYVDIMGLPKTLDGYALDFVAITPIRNKIFDWFMNSFELVDDYYTLNTMCNVVNTT